MSEEADKYKKNIEEIAKAAKETEVIDFKFRYIYRNRVKDQNGNTEIDYITKDLVVKDDAKKQWIGKITGVLDELASESKDVHPGYKFDQAITDESVGILNEEDFPNELKQLIPKFSKAADNTKNIRGGDGESYKLSIVGYAVIFKGNILVKVVKTVNLATGKRFKNSILIGSESNEIMKFEEDLIMLTITEPDFIILKDGEKDQTYIYNSNNFAHVCMSKDEMAERLKSPKSPINKVLDNPTKLHDYLAKVSSVVHVIYFKANRQNFGITQNYIDRLNQQFFTANNLTLDTNNKLECESLDGKQIYWILLGGYGSHLNTDSQTENVIVKQYENI
ncbi:hypothetical protein [Ferroplasma sp.]|uniref:hypothetical protein n=1 Tax=Ferroplasma sp. TaxID=2591003 RepID=UPI0026379C1B|nr:hypothetical protein [Ferroplasma sp.]